MRRAAARGDVLKNGRLRDAPAASPARRCWAAGLGDAVCPADAYLFFYRHILRIFIEENASLRTIFFTVSHVSVSYARLSSCPADTYLFFMDIFFT
jgi:hypothetical protein